MIDIIPGRLFLEKDIQLIESGKYRIAGEPCFAILISLYGRGKPIIATYDNKIEMESAVSKIRKAWTESMGPLQSGESMAEKIRILQERLEETDRRLEEWRALQQEETLSGKKRKTTAKRVCPSRDEVKAELINRGVTKDVEEVTDSIIRVYTDVKQNRLKNGTMKPENQICWYRKSGNRYIKAKDWRRCIGTYIEIKQKGTKKENQFTKGVENNKYDFDALEEELVNSPLAT